MLRTSAQSTLQPRQPPPAAQLPDFRLAGFDYPERLNIGVELTDRMVQKVLATTPALIANGIAGPTRMTDWTPARQRALSRLRVRPGRVSWSGAAVADQRRCCRKTLLDHAAVSSTPN